jgi:hypothetical protein
MAHGGPFAVGWPRMLPLIRLACIGSTLLAHAALPSSQAATFDHSHARWTAVLAGCVRAEGFDYARLAANRSGFDAYLVELHAVAPETLAAWSEPQRYAFWINVYNAHCVARVLEAYPLKSIRRLDGALGMSTAFDQGFIPMRAHHPGRKDADLSLNDVQDGILRRRFRDARVILALHNSARSSPALAPRAYVAEELEAQLESAARAFVNDPLKNRFDPARGELALSELFKWFAEDFERGGKSVGAFLARYAPEQAELARATRPTFLPFDWDLADASSR